MTSLLYLKPLDNQSIVMSLDLKVTEEFVRVFQTQLIFQAVYPGIDPPKLRGSVIYKPYRKEMILSAKKKNMDIKLPI